MKIVFLEPHVPIPADRESEDAAMGGIMSGLVYLGDQLARRGHRIAVIGGGVSHVRASGVGVYGLADPGAVTALQECDVLVAANCATYARDVRMYLRDDAVVVLWAHHPVTSKFQRGGLAHGLDTDAGRAVDYYVFVSETQKQDYLGGCPGLDPAATFVIRNACSTPMTQRPFDIERALTAKSERLEVAYASSHKRGLHVLLYIWPHIRAVAPDARLKVYFAVENNLVDPSGAYHRMIDGGLADIGVDFRGAVSHRQLAEELENVAVLAYPAWYAETSCISVIEALACGCSVVCTDRGALPETTAGYAEIVDYEEVPSQVSAQEVAAAGADDVIGPPTADFIRRFFTACVEEIKRWEMRDPAMPARRRAQSEAFRAGYSWSARALEWETLLTLLIRRKASNGGARPQ